MQCEYEKNVDLQPYNTFNIQCTARFFASIQSTTQLQTLLASSTFQSHPPLIIGSGSNILLASLNREYPGIVLKNEIGGIQAVSQDETHATLQVGSGVIWTTLVEYCLERNLGGLENLSLIPGTVGAAPVQNIAAYGVELNDVLEEVEIVDLTTGEIRRMDKADCQFGYRDSIFKRALKDTIFISAVVVKVTKTPYHRLNTSYGSIQRCLDEQEVLLHHQGLTIRSISNTVCLIRKSKLPDPRTLPNAGSFFQNPVVDSLTCRRTRRTHPTVIEFPRAGAIVIPAAWLIEQCNWKGRQCGQVGVYARHALVLVNHGGAEGRKLLELARHIMQDVESRFGVCLVPEVNVIL